MIRLTLLCLLTSVGVIAADDPVVFKSEVAMTRVDATHFKITLDILDGTALQYKYTRGTWNSVEKGSSCEELSNRTLTVSYGATGTQTENDTVAKWRDLDNCP